MSKTTIARASAVAFLVLLGTTGLTAHAASSLPKCGTPTMAVPAAYAAGSTNTVSWTAPAPVGKGFIMEISTSPAVNPDGSFVSPQVSDGSVPSTTLSYAASGLTEGAHYYQVRAKTNAQVCLASGWSGAVSTIQDQTGPDVAISSPSDGSTTVAEPFTVSGTSFDALSGSDTVTVTVTNTTPGLSLVIAPQTQTVDASTGNWSATFAGPSVGTYLIEASGLDQVGNASATSDSVTVTVVAL